jgi:hypothetical protein
MRNNTHELVVRNQAGDLELIDLFTGEIVNTSARGTDLSEYVFNYKMAVLICQEVRNGRTLLDIGADPAFPSLDIIHHWQAMDRMFAEELRLARKARGEVFHDRIVGIAERAEAGDLQTRQDIDSSKLALDAYKWAAEKADPERFGNKVTHEGSKTNPIVMRVVNTGINRDPLPDVVVNMEEHGKEKSRQIGENEENQGEDFE